MDDPRPIPQPTKAVPRFITFPNLFSIVLAVLLSANYLAMMGDLDWAWQVRTGQLIVETGSLQDAGNVFLHHPR